MKAYISNQFGFSETGQYLLNNLFYPKIKELGIDILDPFVECSKYLDFDFLNNLDKKSYLEVKEFWKSFNSKVTNINNDLMDRSDLMIALLDGGHTVDDGVASEIGYYFNLKKPIFALRTDIRLVDNMMAPINTQIMGYVCGQGGGLYSKVEYLMINLKSYMGMVHD